MSAWTFRCVWPVEDDDAGYAEAREFAATELAELAEEAGARLVGEVSWEMVENERPQDWPHSDLALVAVCEAVPAHPTREQFPALISQYAGEGLNDREIGAILGVPRDSVIYVRRKYHIPAGVPQGYSHRGQIAEPKWPAA